ncbi:GDP-mannose 4,6-dehydratase, partial [Candidatus Pelagibacter sp.]|nr:GDP-mannose 4,6-dehydratase [Candidatus Pelagibacter sp.]
LQLKKPNDYVIATGKSHSVKDFINECVKILNLKTEWVGKGLNERLINRENNKILISIDEKFFRPSEVDNLKGNYKKAKKDFKWKPRTSFSKLVKLMLYSDLEYIKNLKN